VLILEIYEKETAQQRDEAEVELDDVGESNDQLPSR
jgi:hypothetical protein